jgi:hypothetical protein
MSKVDVKSLKKGDVFFENVYGKSVRFTALTDATKNVVVSAFTDEEMVQWTFKGITDDQYVQEFVVTEGLEHYGPTLHSEPAYW